jgi:hypothetical protein
VSYHGDCNHTPKCTHFYTSLWGREVRWCEACEQYYWGRPSGPSPQGVVWVKSFADPPSWEKPAEPQPEPQPTVLLQVFLPGTLWCGRCEKYIRTDRNHPNFECWDGNHYCSGVDGRAEFEVIPLERQRAMAGGV